MAGVSDVDARGWTKLSVPIQVTTISPSWVTMVCGSRPMTKAPRPNSFPTFDGGVRSGCRSIESGRDWGPERIDLLNSAGSRLTALSYFASHVTALRPVIATGGESTGMGELVQRVVTARPRQDRTRRLRLHRRTRQGPRDLRRLQRL